MMLKKIRPTSIISGYKRDYKAVQSKIAARKMSPTKNQIRLLKQYLKDFQIKVHIPEFNTVAEMELWKIEQVKVKLGC